MEFSKSRILQTWVLWEDREEVTRLGVLPPFSKNFYCRETVTQKKRRHGARGFEACPAIFCPLDSGIGGEKVK